MIEIEELHKSYNGTCALDGFSLRVEPGESFGLVGPNGAGKTTLIKILATLLTPDAGRVRVAGLDILAQPRAVRPLIGYLPDVAGLYQDMQVGEFLEFFADAFHLKGPQRQAAVERALARSGLVDRRHAYVEQLSLGMKQRLVLAKTLLHEPKILLLDEPATGLDPLARIELRELLKQWNEQGMTIFISSHILSDLEDICGRVALIANGRNAPDSEGHTVLALRAAPEPRLLCDMEVAGAAEPAARAAASFPGARVILAEGSRLRAEVTGGAEQAAAFLQHLLAAGVRPVWFDTRGLGLEERYRKAFGAEQK
jgi:ABC-2 type transport system ATP-binding protein